MGTHRWGDIKKKNMPADRLEGLDREVRTELIEMELQDLRAAAGKTQEEVAGIAAMTQSQLSKMERRDDHLVSTLRRYVEALGGELEIVAVLGNKRITLSGV